MLTRNGWFFFGLAGVLFVLGSTLNYSELVAMALAMLLCLLLAGAWLCVRPKVEVSRQVPERVGEGETAVGVIQVTNVGRRSAPPMLAIETLRSGSIPIALPALPAGATHETTYSIPTGRRGSYVVGPLTTSHSDPLRLARLSSQSGEPATMIVLPVIHPMSPLPTGRAQEAEGPANIGAPSGGIAFHSLRKYEPGDDVRLIHWRSTARLGNLMVRHTVITNEPRLLIALDTSSAPYDDASFEDAVRIAASLIAAGAERHYPVEFRTTGGVTASIDAIGYGRTDVMDALARVERSEGDAGLKSLSAMAARRKQGVCLGVVTGQPSREMAGEIGRVRGRFEMVTMVQLGERFGRPAIGITGVLGFSADTSADLVRVWKARVG